MYHAWGDEIVDLEILWWLDFREMYWGLRPGIQMQWVIELKAELETENLEGKYVELAFTFLLPRSSKKGSHCAFFFCVIFFKLLWSKKMSGFSYSYTFMGFLRNRLFSPSWVSPGVVCGWTWSMLYGVGFQKKPREDTCSRLSCRVDTCSHLCCRADTCSHLSCRIPVFLHFCRGVQFLRDCLPLWNIFLMFLALIFCRNPLVRCQTTSAEVLVLAGHCRATWILKGPLYIQLHFVQTGSVHQSISARP